MPDENLGASFSIDISNLKAGLAQANRLIRESESQFREAAAGMDDWSNSQEGLEARIDSLNDQISIQQKKIGALVAEKQRIIEKMKDEGASNEEIERAVDGVNKQIERESKQLDRLKGELGKSEKALNDFNKETNEAAENTKKASDNAEALDGSMEKLKGTGKAAAVAIAAIGAAAIGAVKAFLDLSESTREYREDMGKLETAFESAGKSTELATKTYKDFYSVLGEEDRSVEAVNHLAKFVDTEKDMATWTDICTGVWGTFGDSLPIEGLTEASNETAKVGKLTGVLADALNWAGVNEDDFQASLDECNNEQERTQLITKTLNGLYGEAADHYRENNKSVIEARKATSDYNDTLAELGKKAEPITTKVSEGFNRILKAILDILNDSGIDEIGDVIDDAFDAFVDDIIPAIVDGIKWIAKHGETLVSILKAIGLGFAAFKVTNIIMSVVGAFKGMVTALKAAKTAQQGLNTAMAANVIGAVVAAIVLLVDGISSLVKSTEDAVMGWTKMNSAIDENTKINEEWQESMDAARATLGDYSDMTNAAGESSEDLKQKMSEAQAGITKIFENAYSENRELRADEVEAVRKFNEDYIAAQQELAELQGLILKAQTDSLQWQLNNLELSDEETAGILNSLQEKRDEYIAYMDDIIAKEIALLDMRYQKGSLSEKEYAKLRDEALAKQREYRDESKSIQEQAVSDALANLQEHFEIDMQNYNNRTHTFSSLAEVEQFYADKIKAVEEDSNKSAWEKFWDKQALYSAQQTAMNLFKSGMELEWEDYNFITDREISQNTQAFFNWITENKAQGRTLTDQQKQNARDIVAAYGDLPDDLKESGLNSLRGLAKGMEDEFPELKGAAEMDMEELIQAMDDALGNASPSKKTKKSGKNVMLGLQSGLEGEQSNVNSTASRIASGLLSIFSNIFQEHSPSRATNKIGKNFGLGLALGIDESTPDIVASAKDQIAAINGVYRNANIGGTVGANVKTNSTDGLASGLNGGVTVYQTNNYSQAHSRYELYKSKQETAAAVRLALGGAKA